MSFFAVISEVCLHGHENLASKVCVKVLRQKHRFMENYLKLHTEQKRKNVGHRAKHTELGFVMQLCSWKEMQCEIGRTWSCEHVLMFCVSACTNVICKNSPKLVGILKIEHMPTLLLTCALLFPCS